MKLQTWISAVIGGAFAALILHLLFLSFQADILLLFGIDKTSGVSVLSDIVMPLVSTFIGAAAGAVLVYIFQMTIQRNTQEAHDLETLHQGMLALEAQLSDLSTLKRAVVLPVKDRKLRFLEMPGLIGGGIEARLPADFALPLIRLKADELIMRCRLAERQYSNAIAVRNSFDGLREEYLTRLRSAGIGQMDVTSLRKKFKVAGAEILSQLYTTAEASIELIDSAIEEVSVAVDQLGELIVDNYPKKKYTRLKLTTLAGAAEVLQATPPPSIGNLKELYELAGYYPQVHDPETDDVYSLFPLARSDWQSPLRTHVSRKRVHIDVGLG